MNNSSIFSNFFGDNVGNIINVSNANTHLIINVFLLFVVLLIIFYNKSQIPKNNYLIGLSLFSVLTLSPLRIRYSMEWPSHANWAWIVFYLIFLLMFLKSPFSRSFKYPLLAGVFFFIALIENAYHGVMLAFVSIPVLIFSFFFHKKEIFRKESVSIFVRNFLIFGFIAVISVVYQKYLFSKPVQYGQNSTTTVIESASRSPSDRWAFSARPWNYLIPDIDHPVFGDLAVRVNFWIWQHPPYYLTEPFFPKEHTLFLGYTLMALSIYTIWQTYVKKNITGDQKFNVTFFLIIAVTAFIFSMPPYIGIDNLKIYFPSHFIYDFLPQFRAYARYGVFVFIGNAVIAMIGLNYLISKSFINKPHQKFKQNILILLISVLAIFEFIPGKHLISILPTPPYEWLRMQALQQTPLKYIEIPARADYADHLYTYDANIEIINPYLTTRGDAKLIEKMIWDRDPNDKLFCDLTIKLNAKYLFYHEKELNRKKYVQEFMETGVVTPQLKVAMAESWGQPVFGNHVPKTDGDLAKEQITKNMKNFLLHDPKLILIKEYTNDEIIGSRPNKNFSADKFDAVTVFEINRGYCNSTTNP